MCVKRTVIVAYFFTIHQEKKSTSCNTELSRMAPVTPSLERLETLPALSRPAVETTDSYEKVERINTKHRCVLRSTRKPRRSTPSTSVCRPDFPFFRPLKTKTLAMKIPLLGQYVTQETGRRRGNDVNLNSRLRVSPAAAARVQRPDDPGRKGPPAREPPLRASCPRPCCSFAAASAGESAARCRSDRRIARSRCGRARTRSHACCCCSEQ